MSMSRKVWQEFKKKYPDFEKNRKVKVDVGPLIDKFISETQQVLKKLESIEAKMKEVAPGQEKVDAVLNEYYKVAQLIDKSWPGIEKDLRQRTAGKVAAANAKSDKTGKDVQPKYNAFEQAMVDVMDNDQHARVLQDFDDLRDTVAQESGRFKRDLKQVARDMQKYDVSSDW